ncbi:MAG: translocation/assembly module TamB domain-containing protein [bacterium]
MRKVLENIVIFFIISIITAFFVLQTNNRIQNAMTRKILTYLQTKWNAQIIVQEARINFITRNLEFENGIIKSGKQNCDWGFSKAYIHISLFDLFFKKQLTLSLTFNDGKIITGYSNSGLDIITHFGDIFNTDSQGLKVVCASIAVHNINVQANIVTGQESIQKNKTVAFDCVGDFILRRLDSKLSQSSPEWRGSLVSKRGDVFLNGKKLIADLAGNNNFHKLDLDQTWTVTIADRFTHIVQQKEQAVTKDRASLEPLVLEPLDPKKDTHVLNGSWGNNCPKFRLSSRDLDISVAFQKDIINISGSMPVALIYRAYALLNNIDETPAKDFGGVCSITCDIQRACDVFTAHADVYLKKIRYGCFSLPLVGLNGISVNGDTISSRVTAVYKPGLACTGKFNWNRKKDEQSLILSNNAPLNFFGDQGKKASSWEIGPKKVSVQVMRKKEKISGKYQVKAFKKISDDHMSLDGAFALGPDKKSLSFDGQALEGSYDGVVVLNAKPYLQSFSCWKNSKQLVSLQLGDLEHKKLVGVAHFSFIQSLLSQNYQRAVLGSHSYIGISVNQDDIETLTGTVWLNKGRLYVPEARNIIKSFKANFKIHTVSKKIELEEPYVSFFNGHAHSAKIVAQFDDNYALSSVHAPIEFKNLFVNWKNDFYGFISGSFMCSKNSRSLVRIDGDILLQKSLLKNNPFAQDNVESLVDRPFKFGSSHENGFDFSLRVRCDKPIHVQTGVLDTHANLDMFIEYLNNDEAPRLEGYINLEGGFLQFLDNKLYIEYGKIQFVPSHLHDPLIDLIAKNRINKYTVSLQATGSLQKPNILLESSPTLREEQVLGLILAGSENATLQTNLSSMIMQNLHLLLLGNNKVVPKANAFFEKLARPLKYVQITPNFIDQSGRGGIKGVISVDLGKQLHAQIQKNFDLQDDFGFQVEYLLSDDINLKFVKDQRGEIGSEVELRFKM